MHLSFKVSFFFSVFMLAVTDLCAQTGKITTVVGTGVAGFAGDGGPAVTAQINGPSGIRADVYGNLYIADSFNRRIRRVNADGTIITVAGAQGVSRFGGDGGPATSAFLNQPEDIAVDPVGNLYIADSFNNRIRRVSAATGVITTFAGNGLPQYNGEGPATSIGLNDPTGVALDSAGNVYIADQASHRIRKVDIKTGLSSTVAGNGNGGFAGDGGQATAAQLNYPAHIAIDPNDNIYVADLLNHRIRKITAATGIITTIAGSGAAGNGAGGFAGDGGSATAALLSLPYQVAVDPNLNVYIADATNKRIRYVNAATGVINTIAGGGVNADNCAALTSALQFPIGIAVNAFGSRLYIGDDQGNVIRMVFLTDTLSRPKVTSIVPLSGVRKTSYTATLTGSGFSTTTAFTSGCQPGLTTVSVAGAGVSVSNVTVASDSSLSATLTIAADAGIGAHDVTVTTEEGTSDPVSFSVVTVPPTLSSISPARGIRGSTTAITLNGTGFDMTPGATRLVVSGSVISVTDVAVSSPTSLTARFVVALAAPLDTYNVTVITGEGSSNTVTFSVDPQDISVSYAMPSQLNPTEQAPVNFTLVNPSPDPITGRLTITFLPNTNNDVDDPTVTLVSAQASSRTLDFTFASSSSQPTFSIPGILVQAGTVAGTIRFTVTGTQIGARNVTLTNNTFDISVPRLVPLISSARITNRRAAGFDVEITGYSTSRDITSASFQFVQAAGTNLQTSALQLDMSAQFNAFYQSPNSALGGSTFLYVQPFMVQGDVNAIDSVMVTLSNAQGASQPKSAR
jgi:hypothetical protein